MLTFLLLLLVSGTVDESAASAQLAPGPEPLAIESAAAPSPENENENKGASESASAAEEGSSTRPERVEADDGSDVASRADDEGAIAASPSAASETAPEPLGAPTVASDEASGASQGAERTLDERAMVVEVDEVRLSLPTQGDADAWAGEGLRIGIAYGHDIISGTAPAWSYRAHGFLIRTQVRVDTWWALGGSFQYAFSSEGITWAASFESSFYPLRQLGLTLGIGYAGLFLPGVNLGDPFGQFGQPDEVASRTLASTERIWSCEGSGLRSLARAEYLMVVGPHFATGPFAQANMQWTACGLSLGWQPDPDTGKPLVGTQWWRQQGATLGWWLTWR